MKHYRRWKLAAGVVMAGVICTCTGCAAEENSRSAESLTGENEETTENENTANVLTETANNDEVVVDDGTDEMIQSDNEEAGLEGLTVSIYGDSISTFEGWVPYGYNIFYPLSGEVTDINDTWWIRVFDDTGMKLCANASSSGSTCIGDSTALEDPQVGCGDFRITDLSDKNGAYPDIIVVFMGTNDLLMDAPMGGNDGTVVVEEGFIDNFSDAYSLMLDKLETNYPGSEIYCCTLLQVGDYGTKTPYVLYTNGQGYTAEDYSRQIQTIAENKGFPVIDLFNCGIEVDNLQEMTSDGVHPTPEGMKYIAEAVSSTIAAVRSR